MSESFKDKTIIFYEAGKLRPALLDKEAEEFARYLIYSEQKKDKFKKPIEGQFNYFGVSRHQVRRLYDEIKQYKRQLDDKKKPAEVEQVWEEIKPLVKMVRAKTAYMVARMKDKEKRNETKQCYDNLYYFIDKSLNLIDKKEDFVNFCLLFEAVYGFYYGHGGASTK